MKGQNRSGSFSSDDTLRVNCSDSTFHPSSPEIIHVSHITMSMYSYLLAYSNCKLLSEIACLSREYINSSHSAETISTTKTMPQKAPSLNLVSLHILVFYLSKSDVVVFALLCKPTHVSDPNNLTSLQDYQTMPESLQLRASGYINTHARA